MWNLIEFLEAGTCYVVGVPQLKRRSVFLGAVDGAVGVTDHTGVVPNETLLLVGAELAELGGAVDDAAAAIVGEDFATA